MQLTPLSRAVDSTKAAAAMQIIVEKPTETPMETSETSKGIDLEGDITQSIAADMTVLEKRQLVDKLNKTAAKERSELMRADFLASAAGAVM